MVIPFSLVKTAARKGTKRNYSASIISQVACSSANEPLLAAIEDLTHVCVFTLFTLDGSASRRHGWQLFSMMAIISRSRLTSSLRSMRSTLQMSNGPWVPWSITSIIQTGVDVCVCRRVAIVCETSRDREGRGRVREMMLSYFSGQPAFVFVRPWSLCWSDRSFEKLDRCHSTGVLPAIIPQADSGCKLHAG